jgi:hypothetical protein
VQHQKVNVENKKTERFKIECRKKGVRKASVVKMNDKKWQNYLKLNVVNKES